MKRLFTSLTAALLLLPALLQAQSLGLDWFKVSGGGGTSSNGQYRVSGTIGQHDASGPMVGGTFTPVRDQLGYPPFGEAYDPVGIAKKNL